MTDVTELEPAADSPMGEINVLAAANAERLQALANRGHALPPEMVLSLKQELMFELLVGPALRGVYGALFERNLSGILDQWEAQQTLNRLLVPTGPGAA